MPVRIADIAKAASVSPSAVSLALNNKPGISDEVRKKILKITAELGYRTRQPIAIEDENIVIKLLMVKDEPLISNVNFRPFFTGYIEGIEAGARKRRCKLEISFLDRRELKNHIEAGEKGAVPGPEGRPEGKAGAFIIGGGSRLSDSEIRYFAGLARPVVFFDAFLPLVDFDDIDMDNSGGVFRSIEYLYRMGHRNIGLVRSGYRTNNFRAREAAFRDALEYFSLPVQEKYIATVDPVYERTVSDMGRFLDGHAALPSAFFCVNDLFAYGVMKALRNRGISIPGDVSVAAFDDLPYSALTDPPLTTVRVPTRRIGERAVERLVERISNPGMDISEKILVSVELVIRDSVGKMA